MNLRQLEVFQIIAAKSSIKKAAEQLYISQPAVSKTLKELEHGLGVTLFDRINGRLYLNEAGRIFLKRSRKLLREFEELKNAVKPENIPIRIGASITFGESVLVKVLEEFHEEYPETQLPVMISNVRMIREQLLQNQVDIAILEGPLEHPDFISEAISSFPLLIVGQEKFISAPQIDLHQLLELPLLVRESGSSLRDPLEHLLEEKGLSLQPYWTGVSTESLIQGALKGFGVTILPEPLFQKNRCPELKVAKVSDGPLVSHNHLVYLKDKESEGFQHLVQIFKNHARMKEF